MQASVRGRRSPGNGGPKLVRLLSGEVALRQIHRSCCVGVGAGRAAGPPANRDRNAQLVHQALDLLRHLFAFLSPIPRVTFPPYSWTPLAIRIYCSETPGAPRSHPDGLGRGCSLSMRARRLKWGVTKYCFPCPWAIRHWAKPWLRAAGDGYRGTSL
jgi:hypothetical protein